MKRELDIHRDTIHMICRILINEGLVTKTGKFGNYHLTARAYQEPELTAPIFFSESFRLIRSNTLPIFTFKEEEYDEADPEGKKYEGEMKIIWNGSNQILMASI